MIKIDPNQPACGRAGCQCVAVKRTGHQTLCAKHYRFGQMRHIAKYRGKTFPDEAAQELMLSRLVDFACPLCDRKMNWFRSGGDSTVITLQHYRDGSFGLICQACNTRHAAMPGDSFVDLPSAHKWCPKCHTSKPLSAFCTDRGGRWESKRSACRICSAIQTQNYRVKNRDAYNAYQRNWRLNRKLAALNSQPGGEGA